MPFTHQLRSGEGESGNIKAVGEHCQERPEQQIDIKPVELLFVYQAFYTYGLIQPSIPMVKFNVSGFFCNSFNHSYTIETLNGLRYL